VDNTEHTHTVLSLCSGYGGIELGLGLAGVKYRTVAYVEIEAYQCQVLVSKMQAGILPPAPIWTNLESLPVEPFRNRIDILTAGYPCQSFSTAGTRQGAESEKYLWPYIADIIRSVRPFRVFCENVIGHTSLGLREVISDLEGLGYRTEWGIYSATLCGAPHQRKRIFLMGDRTGQPAGESVADADSTGHDTNGRQPRPPEPGNHTRGRREELGDTIGGFTRHKSQPASGQKRSSAATGPQNVRQGNRPQRAGRSDAAGTNSAAELADPGSARMPSGVSGSEQTGNERHANVADHAGGRRSGGPVGVQRPVIAKLDRMADGYTIGLDCTDWGINEPADRLESNVEHRVDRIRSLGNGVVPATACDAWIMLDRKLRK
jgi:DNA (cytosine-5)-methyltransferase 1